MEVLKKIVLDKMFNEAKAIGIIGVMNVKLGCPSKLVLKGSRIL